MIKVIINVINEIKALFSAKNKIVFTAERNDYVAQMAGHGNCSDQC